MKILKFKNSDKFDFIIDTDIVKKGYEIEMVAYNNKQQKTEIRGIIQKVTDTSMIIETNQSVATVININGIVHRDIIIKSIFKDSSCKTIL